MGQINISLSLSFVAALFLIFWLIKGRRTNTNIAYAIATTGFTAMSLELILLFSFQVFYGYIFREIGVLITAFMTGVAAGSLTGIFFSNHTEMDRNVFIGVEAAFILFSSALMLIVPLLGHSNYLGPVLTRAGFFSLLIVSGFLAGIQFLLANKIYQTDSVGKTAGVLYSIDLLGGWLGGVLSGIVILPLLGLLNGCIILISLKLSSLLLLLIPSRK
jgi:spermidine synthase